MSRLALVAVLAIASCNMRVQQLPIGTRIPTEELYAQRADLPGFIQRELAAGHEARAFYALELDKTRPYTQEALAARDRSGPRRAVTDLRPVFAALVDPNKPTVVAQADPKPDDSRGLVLVQTTSAAQTHAQTLDTAFWAHLRRFERRTDSLNRITIGIPYDYAAREAYGVSSMQETGRLFAADEAFLSFFVHGDTVTLFLIVRGGLQVHRLGVRASDLRAQVQRFVAAVRTPPKPGAPDWTIDARALHASLFGSLESQLIGVNALFISPHGFLANLPFGLLADAKGRLALESRRVTYLPSASVYRQLLSRPILNEPPRMLAVGNATYPAGVQPLAFAEKEARTVSELFPDGKLLRGDAATEAKVAELSPSYNILHFATHGVLLGSVVPGGSSLLVTADDKHDGFLSATEIAGQNLSKSYIAVLSACETSVSETATGQSIDLGSITNAFLTAGAPSVLGTMWQVDDVATTALMLDFYQQFLEVGAGEALRRAQLALRANPRYAHPYYWGAFALFGWDK